MQKGAQDMLAKLRGWHIAKLGTSFKLITKCKWHRDTGRIQRFEKAKSRSWLVTNKLHSSSRVEPSFHTQGVVFCVLDRRRNRRLHSICVHESVPARQNIDSSSYLRIDMNHGWKQECLTTITRHRIKCK